MMSYDCPHPVSRTYQYKKITKPLLERKRRARINRCLEELKDLMMQALETEGENISKLEKADILELTVRHLQRLQASRPSGLSTSVVTNEDISAESRWQSGFGHCAAEACRFLSALPGEAAERLAKHLASGLKAPRSHNSVTESDAISTTITNLDGTANVIAPCRSEPISTTNSNVSETRLIKVPNSDPKCQSDVTSPTVNYSIPRNDPSRANAEDEEEIDVERIDERDNDPMWRPW